MYRRIIQSTLLLSLAAVGTACGSDNELSGSISESFSLDFDRTEVRYLVTTNELTIQYLRDLGNTTSKPVKVVVDATDLTLGEDTRISGDVFAERVVIQREAETGGDFPEPNGGTVVFDRINLELQEMTETIDGEEITFFTEPAGEIEVKGEFDAVFDNGRTLFGK
ncbi:MAG: hypothetical protein AAFY60_21435, partial [Myxococcota bacterium]